MATGVIQERFTVKVETVDGAVVLALAGELDHDTASALRRALDAALVRAARLVVDLTELGFCDSAGLNELLRGRLAVQEAGGAFRVGEPRGPVARMFRITGVDRVFDVYADVAQALGRGGGT
ncbi:MULTISPECIES: STAS domain-containing protein [unclassified Streptomyces]|uniref:STAS domain-containing protein n=1 Tax=unclassified Streptomyces TaxID=2593676 RepID=UPI00224D2224|nr:STAS domain-containing protein [Streptomyces sp. NBC_01551]MCX4524614.1 STAS domain-containing protein [Streptomyces sp. NBC_01551]